METPLTEEELKDISETLSAHPGVKGVKIHYVAHVTTVLDGSEEVDSRPKQRSEINELVANITRARPEMSRVVFTARFEYGD